MVRHHDSTSPEAVTQPLPPSEGATTAAPPSEAVTQRVAAHEQAPTGGPARVVVADDHPLYRQGIVRALEAAGGIEVVGEAADGTVALTLIRALEPDVALLDLSMPGDDGIDVVAALARHGPRVPVVLLSAFDDQPLIDAGLEAGAAAYVPKTSDRDEICRQVRIAAAAGESRSPAALAPRDDYGASRMAHWTPRLTLAEHELLQLLAHGGWNKAELALLTHVDEATVRRRLSSAVAKLGADTVEDALEIAAERGIVR